MAIVVGVDGSAESIDALRWAIAEARLRKTDVRAVHVWQFPPLLSTGDPFVLGSGLDPALIEPSELRKLAESRLADAVVAAGADVAAVEQVLVEGHPAEGLVEAAEGEELLVVGSRGHGGVAGMLLGSVGQECAHHARCPVVIVRGATLSES
jgi:nucleotide-binding universal stress UspA family protein